MKNSHCLKAILISSLLVIGCAPPSQESVLSQKIAQESDLDAIEVKLREQLASKDWRVQLTALERLDSRRLLGELSRHVPLIVEVLQSSSDEAKQKAADTLSSLLSYGPRRESVPELETTINPLSKIISGSHRVETRRWALIALTDVADNLGSNAIKQVMPVFSKAVADQETEISEWALDGLAQFGPKSESAIPVILNRLSDKSLRASATKTLGKIHRQPQICVPKLLKVLDDLTPKTERGWREKRTPIESVVANALAEFGPKANQAVPALTEMVGEQDAKICFSAAFALANIGVDSPQVLDSLEKAYGKQRGERDSVRVRIATVGALCALGLKGKSRAEKLLQGTKGFTIDGVGFLMIKPAETLEVISRISSVTSLQLVSSDLSDDELAPITKMSQLQVLVLPELASDKALRHVAGLTNLRVLEHQSLYRGNQMQTITDEGFAHLSNLSNLQRLSLWSSLQSDGLKHLSRLKQLRQLSLHGVGDNALLHLPDLPLLQNLLLSGDKLTDSAVAQLSSLQSLKTLNLNGTKVGDAGVKTLAHDHPDLVELYLWHTPITGASVAYLAKMKKLQELGVVNTPLADRDYETLTELKRRLPKCNVVSLD